MTRIRQATESDIPVLSLLIRKSFKEVADRYRLTVENCPAHPSNCDKTWIAQDMRKGIVYFILEQGTEAIGCVAMDFPEAETCVLQRLAVTPECRRNGFGKALVSHIIQQASTRRCKSVTLAIIAQSSDLKRWYESLGFIETKTVAFPQLPFEVTSMERRA